MHPDGRLQRLRRAIAHPGEVRAGWSVIAELACRAGLDAGVLTAPMAFAELVAGGPVLRGHHARGDRRRAACAGPSARRRRRCRRRPHAGEASCRGAGGHAPMPRRPPRANGAGAAQRRAPARDLPLDLGRARGRDLAGAPVHCRRTSRSSCRPTTRRGWASANGEDVERSRRTATHAAGHRPACARAIPAAPRSSPTGSPTDRPTRFTEPVRRRCSKAAMTLHARRRQLLRAVVDPDRQGARDLRDRLRDPADAHRATSASCSAASRAATARTASARSASLQPLAEIVKFAIKEPFRPTTSVGYLFRIAPDDRDPHARSRALAIIPWGDVQHIFGTAGRACTGSTSRSGRCTCSRSAASRSTGSCSAAGRRARSTRSSARCAAPPS